MIKHDHITNQKRSALSLKPMMAISLAAAIFFIAIINYHIQFRMADTLVYLDVNPSIQITTNKKEQVIGLQAANGEGSDIIKDIDFTGKNLYSVTEEILSRLVEQTYIQEPNEIMLVSVYNEDIEKRSQQSQTLTIVINQYLEEVNLSPILLTQTVDQTSTLEEYAKHYGISVGKMTFIRNLIILNPDFKMEDLVHLSLVELIQLAQNYNLDLGRIIDSTNYQRLAPPTPALDTDDDEDDAKDDKGNDDEDEDNDVDGDDGKDVEDDDGEDD